MVNNVLNSPPFLPSFLLSSLPSSLPPFLLPRFLRSSLPSFLPSSLPPKMYVFMNMVIARVKNWSPDIILKAFEGKADEKKDEAPPGFVDLICFKIFSIGDLVVDIKHKNGHKWGPRGSPKASIWHAR